MRPIIGLVVDGISRAEGTRLAQVIDEAGGAPVRWPLAAAGACPDDELLKTWLSHARGVVLWPMSEEPMTSVARRRMLEEIHRRRIPLLAAEEGLRAVTSWAGGNYRTPDGALMRHHFCPHGTLHRHSVSLSPLSRLDSIYGDSAQAEHLVGSRHRWKISRRPATWTSTAISADGVIEALEHAGETWWALAVAWPLTGQAAGRNEEVLVRELVERAG